MSYENEGERTGKIRTVVRDVADHQTAALAGQTAELAAKQLTGMRNLAIAAGSLFLLGFAASTWIHVATSSGQAQQVQQSSAEQSKHMVDLVQQHKHEIEGLREDIAELTKAIQAQTAARRHR